MNARRFCVLLATLALLSDCARRETTSTEERIQHQQSAEDRLSRLQAEIDTLDAKTRAASESLRVELAYRVGQLKVQRDSLSQKLTELKAASHEAWENVKSGTDEMLERLEHGIAETRERLHSRADTTRG